MAKKIQAIRGMNDILPADIVYWQHLEKELRQVCVSYGYEEIRFPIVEQTALFQRTIGTDTDIVAKEMYTFEDRNGDSITLRPEGTAGCVRAGIQQGLLYNKVQRFWYMGPMFRHERPQKGRYRQFYQFGVEAFGMSGPDIDAELILMTQRLWQRLNIADKVTLQINSLGSRAARARYREQLVAHFKQHIDELDEDSLRRLGTNPLRILDSKNVDMQALIASAPALMDYLDESSQMHFDGLRHYLDSAGIAYEINPRLVRGLDYYGLTVFEWITQELGAQGTVCAGGRYDALVEELGGKPTLAVGFAMGLERLVTLLQAKPIKPLNPFIYIVMHGEEARKKGLLLAEQLHHVFANYPEVGIVTDCGSMSIKSQFKRADKSGAEVALILGDEELAQNFVSVKFLRQQREQERVNLHKLNDWVCHQLLTRGEK